MNFLKLPWAIFMATVRGMGIVSTVGGTGAPTPPTGGTGVPSQGGRASIHNITPHASKFWRGMVFAALAILLFEVILLSAQYTLPAVGVRDVFYHITLALILWIGLVALLVTVFLKTIGVYQLGHTQDWFGKLRRYDTGAHLFLPWEDLTDDCIISTEAVVLTIPDTEVTTADGSPLIASGSIRWRVDPTLSHLFIGVKRTDVDSSLLATVIRYLREETTAYGDPEKALKHLAEKPATTKKSAVPGLLARVEDKLKNGVSQPEWGHGIIIEAVLTSIRMSPEIKKLFLERFEDKRLADSATALKGKEKEARLALLNNPNSKLSHTVSEEIEGGDRSFKLTIDGAAGDTLKDIGAAAFLVAKGLTDARQQKGGGGGPPKKKPTA